MHLMNPNFRQAALAAFVCACIGLLPGCGSNGPATGAVEGQITYNNQPVTQGNVVYENAERGWAYVAALDAEGRFRLAGVNLAEYKVSVKPIEPKAPDETNSATGVIPPKAA